MAISLYYVDPAIAADSGTGTIGDPYGDLQYALNTLTRNATDGDQINIKAGTAELLAATLSFAAYGTPTNAAPLILRGYTSAANDGGMGEIRATGAWSTTPSLAYLTLRDLLVTGTTSGNYSLVSLGGIYNTVIGCIVDLRATGGGVIYSGINFVGGAGCHALGNQVIGTGYRGITSGATAVIIGNYVSDAASGGSGSAHILINIDSGIDNVVAENIIVLATVAAIGANLYYGGLASNNTIYQTAAGTAYGIYANQRCTAVNNIVCGFSGVGGFGIHVSNLPRFVGANAFYNNTANYNATLNAAFTGSADVALGANPFTDAANGDFSLTAAAKAALRSAGWPASYLGAHANTDPHITIGPLQYGPAPAASGAVSISPVRGVL